MFLRKVRGIGRVFALALLAWTAVDLLDRRACQNHPDLLVPPSSNAAGRLDLPGGPTAPHDDHSAFPPGHAGDCFCCSAFVDVKIPFTLPLTSTFVWLEPTPFHRYSSIPLRHVYRPPIALRG